MAELEVTFDRNFGLLSEEELNTERPYGKELEISFIDESYASRQSVHGLIFANGLSSKISECLNLQKNHGFRRVGTVNIVDVKATKTSASRLSCSGSSSSSSLSSSTLSSNPSQFVKEKQAKPVELLANYDASDPNQTTVDSSVLERLVIVNMPHVPQDHAGLLVGFLLQHFQLSDDQTPVIVFDFLEKGMYSQSRILGRTLDLPLLRTVKTTALFNEDACLKTSSDDESISTMKKKVKRVLFDITPLRPGLAPLETRNVISTAAASCEWRDQSAVLYLSVTDLPFFGDSLSQLSLVLLSYFPSLEHDLAQELGVVPDQLAKLSVKVAKHCNRWGDDRLDLNPGVVMFM